MGIRSRRRKEAGVDLWNTIDIENIRNPLDTILRGKEEADLDPLPFHMNGKDLVRFIVI